MKKDSKVKSGETPAKVEEKEIQWLGNSLDDLKAFPEEARKNAGFELGNVQAGLTPEKAKPYTTIGSGIQELVIDSKDGWNRVMYVAKFPEAVYVLHAFEKRTNKISRPDQEMLEKRYKDMLAVRAALKK